MDLAQFQRPQRYVGNEWNVVKKSHHGRIKIAVSYPDNYDVGMSNLGLRILYGLFNAFEDVVCERVFLPGFDLAEFLKNSGQPLFSLETKSAIKQFDILCFNFNYELNYTNFLSILALSGIPFRAVERADIIIIGGGMVNPEPLADFVDVFFLGEFEDSAAAFIDVLRRYHDKESRLKALAEIDGFYVPKFYSVSFDGRRYNFEKKYSYARFPVRRVHVKDLDNAYYPRKWLVPYAQIVHDRVPLEIARGCPNRCVFCQARAQYYPYRQRSAAVILKMLEEIYQSSGYEDFSLLSLSASDYSGIEDLIDAAFEFCRQRRIGISLPSLRVDDILGRLQKRLQALKKTSLTVAVEAARPCLREKLNKNIDINKLYEAARLLRSLSIRHLKVYFMFGFPGETEDDLAAIGGFLNDLSRGARIEVNASLNIFIPKPLSIWENAPMEEERSIERKRDIIMANMPGNRSIKLAVSFGKRSILEAITCRSGREFGAVIERAFSKGAKSDGEQEYFNWDIWATSMREQNLDYRFYLAAATDNFPWSFIEGPAV